MAVDAEVINNVMMTRNCRVEEEGVVQFSIQGFVPLDRVSLLLLPRHYKEDVERIYNMKVCEEMPGVQAKDPSSTTEPAKKPQRVSLVIC